MSRTVLAALFALTIIPASADTGPEALLCIRAADNIRHFNEAGATSRTIRGSDAQVFVDMMVSLFGAPPKPLTDIGAVTIHTAVVGDASQARTRFYDSTGCDVGLGMTTTADVIERLMQAVGISV